jgi:hypothetical protein
MLIDKILNAISETEEWVWESEAPFTYYNIKYDIKNKEVEVSFIEEYHYDGDNWGEIETMSDENPFYTEVNVSEKDFINLLITVTNSRQELDYRYGTIVNKINFVPL